MSTSARLCRSFCWSLSFVMMLLPVALPAQTTRAVPASYSTIQSAIDASVDGDTVVVAPGTYYEHLTLSDKAVLLQSRDGAASTTLDGSRSSGPVVTVLRSPAGAGAGGMTGFTVQNGSPAGSSPGSLSAGAGGLVISNARFTVADNVFTGNIGGGITVLNSSVTLSGNQIFTVIPGCSGAPNPSASAQPGLYLYGTSPFLPAGNPRPIPSFIHGNTIYGDGSRCSGVGVQVSQFGQSLELDNNTLRNNSIGLVSDSPLHLAQNLIYDNVAGALALTATSAPPNTDPATTLITSNTIVNNNTSRSDLADITLSGTAAHTAFVNNILVGGLERQPVLTCEAQSPSLNDTPLLFEHNDLFNNSGGALAAGDCFAGLTDQLATRGNLSIDPRLSPTSTAPGARSQYPAAGSPVIDAGTNSAPDLVNPSADDLGFSIAPGDLLGSPRIVDGTGKGSAVVDMGAYEVAGPPTTAAISTVKLTSDAYDVPAGTTIHLTATALSGSGAVPATGSLNFFENDQHIGPVAQQDGSATLPVTLSSPGLYTFYATLTPAPSSTPAASVVLYVRVTDAPPAPTAATTLTISASPGTTTLNQPIVLTMQLGSTTTSGGITQPGPVPPGALSLYDGTTLLTFLQSGTGVFTYTDPKPSVGTHIYTAKYAGTTVYPAATASTSPAVVVHPLTATTVEVNASPNPAASGETVTLTATVAATTGSTVPTGQVTFTDGATILGGGPVNLSAAGTASLQTATLARGPHTITVTYAPDPAFSGGSNTVHLTIGGAGTALAITGAPAAPNVGQSVTFTIAVTRADGDTAAALPTGSVTLTDAGTPIASRPLPAGSNTLSLKAAFTTAGPHTIVATYLPATPDFLPSFGSLIETVTAQPVPTLALTAALNPAGYGQTLSFYLAVTQAPAASVLTLLDGTTPLATSAGPIGSSYAFTLAAGTLSPGTHSLSATLRSPAGVLLAASNLLLERVTGSPTSLSLAASPAPSALAGASVILTASLTSSLPSGEIPTGTVTFFDGSTPLGSRSVDSTGHATWTTSALTTGAHTLTASYSGNAVLADSTSAPVAERIDSNPTATTLTAPPSAVGYRGAVLNAHVTPLSAIARAFTPVCNPGCTPASVTFSADTPAGHIILGTAIVDAQTGDATLVFTPVPGSYELFATFSGSALFAASTSTPVTLVVEPAPTELTLTISPNPVYQHGHPVVTVSLHVPGGDDAGTVTFSEDGVVLGTVPFPAADFKLPEFTGVVGTHTLAATYSGNADLRPSSAETTFKVLSSDFSVSVKDPTMTISTTHHAPTTVALTSDGLFADTVAVSCAGLPQYASCTFTPEMLSIGASGSAAPSSGTLTIDTDALLNYAGNVSPEAPFGLQPSAGSRSRALAGGRTGLTALLALSLPVTLLGVFRRRGPHARCVALPNLLATLLLSVAALTLSSCSGRIPPHAAPGTYIVTITGHAQTHQLDHSTTVTLVVTP